MPSDADPDLVLYDKELDNVNEHCRGKRLLYCERRDGWPTLVFEDGTQVRIVHAEAQPEAMVRVLDRAGNPLA